MGKKTRKEAPVAQNGTGMSVIAAVVGLAVIMTVSAIFLPGDRRIEQGLTKGSMPPPTVTIPQPDPIEVTPSAALGDEELEEQEEDGEDEDTPWSETWDNYDEIFLLLDENRDQKLDATELANLPEHPNLIVEVEIFLRMGDKNGDGALDASELVHEFELLDKIVNQKYSQEDWREYAYHMQDMFAVNMAQRPCYSGPAICSRINQTIDKQAEMHRSEDVDTIHASELTPERFYSDYLRRNRPILIKGGAAHWPAMTKWTDEYLRDRVGPVAVNAERSRTNKFGYEEKSWLNVINGTEEERFTWSRFLDVYERSSAPHYYISSNIPRKLAEDVELPSVVPCMKDRHEWTILWMGAGGQNSLIHNDQFDNLFAIIAGSKKIVLFPPLQSPYLYEDKYLHAKGKVSAVNFDTPDYEKQPLQRYVTYQEVTVEAGDIMFIPLFWWHQVYSTGRTIGVTYWFDMWKKSSLVGSGSGRGTDQNMRTFLGYMHQHGAPCGKEQGGGPLSAWPGCADSRDADNCAQTTARHDFCLPPGGSPTVTQQKLAKTLLAAWEAHTGGSAPLSLPAGLSLEYSRRDVNAAVGFISPCEDKVHDTRYTEFVEQVGDALYFKNEEFRSRVVQAAASQGGELRALLDGFSKEELFRLFVENLDDLGLEYDAAAERIDARYARRAAL